jgi:hypothetical protein
MPDLGKELTLDGKNGSMHALTEKRVGTHLSCFVHRGWMFGVFDNDAKTRRFLRTVLGRMEREAKEGKRRA